MEFNPPRTAAHKPGGSMQILELIKDIKGPYSLSAFIAFLTIKALVHTRVINNPQTQRTVGNLAYIAIGSAALLLILGQIKVSPEMTNNTNGPGSPIINGNTGSVNVSTEINQVAEPQTQPPLQASSSANRQ